MASKNPPRGVYDDATLDALEQALTDIWQVLKAHAPYPDWEVDAELKTHLAFTLMTLVDCGVSDPRELRRKTLQSLPLGRCH
jgi:hypothetical protein